MGAGINKLARAIRNLQEFLEKTLTKDFIAKLKQLMDNANGLLSDPNLKGILDRLNEVLKEGGDLSIILKRCREILQKVDDEKINVILGAIAKLLTDMEKNNFAENLCKALQTINSMGQFVTVATSFLTPTNIMIFGTLGPLAGAAMMKVVESYFTKKGDEELKKLVQLGTQSLYVSMLQLRQSASMSVLMYHMAAQGSVDFGSDAVAVELSYEEAKSILRNTQPASAESLQMLQVFQREAESMLAVLYQDALNNPKAEEIIDQLALPFYTAEEMTRYVVYSGSAVGRNPVPSVDRDNLSYKLMRRLYDNPSNHIHKIMLMLSDEFKHHGSDQLYYQLVAEWEDSAERFIAIAQLIPYLTALDSVNYESFGLTPWQPAVSSLVNAFKASHQFVQSKWSDLRNTQPLAVEHSQLIALRAFYEYCKNVAKYFFAPYNIPRESLHGAKDTVVGFYNLFRHPLNTIKETVLFPYGMVTNYENRRDAFVSAAKAHPTRLFSGLVTNLASNVVIGKVAHSVPSLNKAVIKHPTPLATLRTVRSTPSAAHLPVHVRPHPVPVVPLIPAVGSGHGIAQVESKAEDRESSVEPVDVTVELSFATLVERLAALTSMEEAYQLVQDEISVIDVDHSSVEVVTCG